MTRTLLPPGEPIYDLDLLRTLRGTPLAAELQVLCVIGAHRFDELPLVDRLFPALRRIYVFEPLPGPLAVLHGLAAQDPRIRVFPVAVSDRDGTARFNVASNNGESSSLLGLGAHREIFPDVTMRDVIEVSTRRLDSVLAEHGLEAPDLLIVDVQGAEYQVLGSLPPALLDRLRLIYSEVSTEPLYEGSRRLADVEALLAPRFVNLGFAPLQPGVPMHGNAIFVARDSIDAALGLSLHERMRRGFHRTKRWLRSKWAGGGLPL